MKLYALKEINTGLFYSEESKDITALGIGTTFYETKEDAEEVFIYHSSPIPDCQWFTTLSAIEKMYDKPIWEVELNWDLLLDTASLFKFKVVPVEIREVELKDE